MLNLVSLIDWWHIHSCLELYAYSACSFGWWLVAGVDLFWADCLRCTVWARVATLLSVFCGVFNYQMMNLLEFPVVVHHYWKDCHGQFTSSMSVNFLNLGVVTVIGLSLSTQLTRQTSSKPENGKILLPPDNLSQYMYPEKTSYIQFPTELQIYPLRGMTILLKVTFWMADNGVH